MIYLMLIKQMSVKPDSDGVIIIRKNGVIVKIILIDDDLRYMRPLIPIKAPSQPYLSIDWQPFESTTLVIEPILLLAKKRYSSKPMIPS